MTSRRVRLTEPTSGLVATLELLDGVAPTSSAALWTIAGMGFEHAALHAMWSGPEISWQVPASRMSSATIMADLKSENATTHPAVGDIALTAVAAANWPGSGGDLIDVGLFYAGGARLLLPHGWVSASVCARIAAEDMAGTAAA